MPTEEPTPTRRLRKVPAANRPRQPEPGEIQAHELRQWWIDFRFVREVERLEREGRVPSRGQLESSIGLNYGTLALVRQGRLGINAGHIAALKQVYNGDYEYILFGVRQDDKSGPLVWSKGKAVKKLDVYPPFYYEYRKPAGWKVGPQPEADARHYPSDPENTVWVPHQKANPKVHKQKASASEAEASEAV